MPSTKSNNKLKSKTFIFEAIGTKWTIDIRTPLLQNEADLLFEKILTRIDEFDKNYSRFRSDSLVTEMSRVTGHYRLPNDAKKMLDLYEKLYSLTKGLMTPLIGKSLEEAGYDANYSLTEKQLSPVLGWGDAMDYDFPNLHIKKNTTLDFGAIGKGYLIDIIGELLLENDCQSFIIDAGGDILNKGKIEITVGLENPLNTTQVIGICKIQNNSICGSATNRRNWGKFHHIINPHSLSSVQDILGVWVVAKETIIADGLSTALFFVNPKILESDFQFEYLILNSDFSITKSDNFPGEVFLS